MRPVEEENHSPVTDKGRPSHPQFSPSHIEMGSWALKILWQ
jgi:hypothetical protein